MCKDTKESLEQGGLLDLTVQTPQSATVHLTDAQGNTHIFQLEDVQWIDSGAGDLQAEDGLPNLHTTNFAALYGKVIR